MSGKVAALVVAAALVLPATANANGLAEAPLGQCARPLVQTAVATVKASPNLSTLLGALKTLVGGIKSAKASLAEYGTCTPPPPPPPGGGTGGGSTGGGSTGDL